VTRASLFSLVFAAATLSVLSATPNSPQQAPPPPPASQTPQQAPVFRAGVETVAIYATVVDRYGEMVLNLTRTDFDIYDNGVKQDLNLFVTGLQPITAILLVDTSASMTVSLDLARAAAEQFVIRMLPGDQARVGSFSDRLDLSPSFSGNRDAILKSLREGLHIGNPTRLWDSVEDTMTALSPVGGRRVLMLLTDGQDTMSQKRADEVLTRARADELMIYAVQFRSTLQGRLAEVPLAPRPGQVFTDDRFRNPPPTEALRRIALQTGGGHFLLGEFDDINTTFTRVMHELHYQYVLGFTPQKADGRIHTLDVRVRVPGMTVRSRQSYQAPRPPDDRPQP
jgi:Ca-activated chloride channel family protein